MGTMGTFNHGATARLAGQFKLCMEQVCTGTGRTMSCCNDMGLLWPIPPDEGAFEAKTESRRVHGQCKHGRQLRRMPAYMHAVDLKPPQPAHLAQQAYAKAVGSFCTP